MDKVNTDTTSGEISLSFDSIPDSVNTNAVSGNVTIFLPRDAGFRAKLSSLSGSVKCDLADEDDKEYSRGNEECTIEANSVSGDLTLKEN